MPEGDDMNQRELGEITAGLRYLTQEIASLRETYSADSARIYARLEEIRNTSAPRDAHEKLEQRVDDLRDRFETIYSETNVNSTGLNWLHELVRLAIAIAVAAVGLKLTGF